MRLDPTRPFPLDNRLYKGGRRLTAPASQRVTAPTPAEVAKKAKGQRKMNMRVRPLGNENTLLSGSVAPEDESGSLIGQGGRAYGRAAGSTSRVKGAAGSTGLLSGGGGRSGRMSKAKARQVKIGRSVAKRLEP